jgi:antitoxin component YwqK of YwqJK toxin-antitoxin module
MRLHALAVAALASACLVQRSEPDEAAPAPQRETRTTRHMDGSVRSESSMLVWPDGRAERHGVEREYHASGALASEGRFEHGAPAGVWRPWFQDGTPRSEVDFGTPGAAPPRAGAPGRDRFWHANGALAAEGPSVGGIREGRWQFFAESGVIQREGAYRAGRRDGAWTFYDATGARRAEGAYSAGARVGAWTLWDEHGVAHERPPGDPELERELGEP